VTIAGVPLALAAAWLLRVGRFHRRAPAHASRRGVILAVLLAALSQTAAITSPSRLRQSDVRAAAVEDTRALQEFNHALDGYVALHRTLERSLPAERMFDDPREAMAAADALSDAIRTCRRDARRGDVFTPDAGRYIRQVIARTLVEYGARAGEISRFLSEPLRGARRPRVNHRYDWRLGAWMWGRLLQELPPLPGELEYRIVGAHLVLIDLRANLVVDILKNAMPRADS
jgi:hypothetical protein